MKLRLLRQLSILAAIVLVYPIGVIGFTWGHVLRSDFEGGRHGPLDAYRHALASATVSYSLGKWAVDLTTWVLESNAKDSGKMDIHKNRIGAEIGARSGSFSDLEPTVRQAVLDGGLFIEESLKIVWLSPATWRDSKFW
jgi:hypothetical protein